MASKELFEISRSRTLRSRRASAASSETDLDELGPDSGGGGDRGSGRSRVVSIDCGGLLMRGMVADFTSWVNGDGVASTAVADRRRDWCELPESIEDKLGDFLCGVTRSDTTLGRWSSEMGSKSTGGLCVGRRPKIWDAPLR